MSTGHDVGHLSMNSVVLTIPDSREPLPESFGEREELVRRVASSVTFEKSPRLRAFFLHVSRCALENKPEEATEQQIGIHVYGRSPGYNPNEDNIVRSQARVLRMKLEHHFANEGKRESTVITVPKGRYLPVFESRREEPEVRHVLPVPAQENTRRLKQLAPGAVVLLVTLVVWFGFRLLEPKSPPSSVPVATHSVSPIQPDVTQLIPARRAGLFKAGDDAIRIAAGRAGSAYSDVWGGRWDADRYYHGGILRPGPRHFFPPVADEGFLKSIRQAASTDDMVPQSERQFSYDIPLDPGVYELRLYFADPLRQPETDTKEDAQNSRHFVVSLNGRPILTDFDPIADAGGAAVDVRTFMDVGPASDGKLHLEFVAGWGAPPFVSALELSKGTPGKLKPIRIAAQPSDFVDSEGTRWSADKYFIDGRTWIYANPDSGPKIPLLYTGERHGNFSYAIPVPSGSYTVRLHFLESFFNPLIPAAPCHGAGCRIFDVTCNGVMLLQNFDIFRAAGGAFKPIVREFHGLHPNGQGKLLLSFSPEVNYAEVRAIEVVDEAR
jgi:hypothetical protein